MSRSAWIWLAALLLLGSTPTAARNLDATALEALARARWEASDAPGMVIAVRRGGEVWTAAYGSADLEQGRAMQPATMLPIASITKAFVAVSILLLQQEGALSLQDPLSRFLPDYPHGAEITLAQLLTHTAGVPNFVNLPAFAGDQAKDWTPQELVALFRDLPLTSPPGTACLYSDSGFILLGLVIEQVAGKPFGAFVRDRIATPLGMATTAAGSNRPLLPLRGAGYEGKRAAWQNAPYVSWTAPFSAGGLVSAIDDLLKLAAVLEPGGPLLDQANRAAMVAPVRLADGSLCSLPLPGAAGSYGYGLELVTFDALPEHRALGKSGVFPGYGAYLASFEGSDLSVALIANGDGSLAFLVSLARDIALLLLGK